jgi:hypothetical protein
VDGRSDFSKRIASQHGMALAERRRDWPRREAILRFDHTQS